ncbi:MAG: hypothetical protein K2G27_08725, partial [Duncaniella sp.]|nr:hypothetical protein [Duncaniella sp.]
MKKIFTLLGSLLVSGASLVNAEQQTITVEIYGDYDWSYDYTEVGSYDINITNNDGVYTIDNFLQSGAPLSFTLGRGISADSHTFINFVNNVNNEYYKNYAGVYSGGIQSYILKPDSEENIVCKLWTDDAKAEKEVETPYIFNALDETYAQLSDNLNGNYEITMKLYAVTNHMQFPNDPTIYDTERCYRLKFYLNAPEPNATPLTIKVLNENGTSESNLPYATTLTVDEKEGIYTISNFLDSTQPMSFSFDPNDPNDNSIAITLKDNVIEKEVVGLTYNYITQFDGKPDTDSEYLSKAVYHTQGETRATSVSKPYIDLTKSYLVRVDKAENDGKNYKANIYVGSGSGLHRNLQFYFEGPDKSGISLVEADNENAPVEYYNLNGQRVNNPANGIFVRKQGSKVEKVVIK